MKPDFVVTVLTGVPELGLGASHVSGCEVVPLKENASRTGTILLFKLQVRRPVSPSHTVLCIVGKIVPSRYGEPPRGKDSFEIIRELWENGFGEGNHLVCRPVAYVRQWNLMLTAVAQGTGLLTLLANSDGSFPDSVKQAARWLSKLHRTATSCRRKWTLEQEVAKLDRVTARVGTKHPDLADSAREIGNRIRNQIGSVNPDDFTLIHADYQLKNLFADGPRFTVVDFDETCIFDPAKDLGKFVGMLTVKGWQYRVPFDVRSLRALFLESYSGELPQEVRNRILAYESYSFLKHAKKQSSVNDARFWLHEAEGCLTSIPGSHPGGGREPFRPAPVTKSRPTAGP